jgi:hypothetical protein
LLAKHHRQHHGFATTGADAKNAVLTITIGGVEADFERVLLLFQAMGNASPMSATNWRWARRR